MGSYLSHTPAQEQEMLREAGYRDGDYTLCRGRVPCAVAVLRKE